MDTADTVVGGKDFTNIVLRFAGNKHKLAHGGGGQGVPSTSCMSIGTCMGVLAELVSA